MKKEETSLNWIGVEEGVSDTTWDLCKDFEKDCYASYKRKPLYFRENQWTIAKTCEFVTYFNSGSLFPYISGAATMTPPDLEIIQSGKKNHEEDLCIKDKAGRVAAKIEVKAHPYDSKGSLSWVFKRWVSEEPADESQYVVLGYWHVSGQFEIKWLVKMKDLQELDLFTELDRKTDSMVCVRESDLLNHYIEEVEPDTDWISSNRIRTKLFEYSKKQHFAELERNQKFEERQAKSERKLTAPWNRPDIDK